LTKAVSRRARFFIDFAFIFSIKVARTLFATMTDEVRRTTRQPLDKENDSIQFSILKGATKPQSKTPLHKTPARRRQPLHQQSPPVSSKVLRQHFAQLSVTPQRNKIQSGAVRVQSRKKKPQPAIAHHHSPTRIGIDGTSKTPSKELLRSTVCSRNHQIHFTEHDYLHAHEHDEAIEVVKCKGRRQECCDPVALTLMSHDAGTTQDLQEPDTSLSPPPSLRKVSSNLEDVLDDTEISTLVRPIPRVARS
jgi:hypothetical protein